MPWQTHLFGQIVVDDEPVHSVVSEVLSHGTAGVRGQVLQGSGLGSGGGHDDGVLDGIWEEGYKQKENLTSF